MSRCLFTFLFGFLFSVMAIAQPLSKEKDLKPYAMKLLPDAGDKELLVAGAEGNATEKGELILLSGQEMFQPLVIMVYAADRKQPVQVSLHKDSWDDAEMNASTDATDGYCEFKIRSAGEVGIKLRGASAPYVVMAMAGKEVPPKIESPFVKKGKEKAPAKEKPVPAAKNNSMLYMVAGLLLLILLAVIVIRFGRKKKATVILVIIFLSAVSAQAQRGIRGNSVEEIRKETERIIGEHDEKAQERVGKVKEKAETVQKALKSGQELWEAYKNLGSCMNTAIPPGMPSVPSFCYETDEDETGAGECAACFREARQKFNDIRYRFIKLSVIYNCTKSFADKSMAFGDDASAIHGVVGLAWQAEKRKIEESVERLKKSYDDKYIELLQRLHDAMMDLDTCEEQFGERDWFDRFGFVFYEFMKEKYRRS